jgi:hypothetical protein
MVLSQVWRRKRVEGVVLCRVEPVLARTAAEGRGGVLLPMRAIGRAAVEGCVMFKGNRWRRQ